MQLSHYQPVDHPNLPPCLKPDGPWGQWMPTLEVSGADTIFGFPASLKLDDLYLPHVTVRTMKGVFAENVVFLNQRNVGADMIGICLFLDGSVTTTLADDGKGKGVHLQRGLHTMKFDPRNELAHWNEAGAPFHIMHLSVEQPFLFSMLPEDEAWSAALKEKIVRGDRILGDTPATISAAQYKAMQALLDCPLDGKLRLVMLETYLTQIILYQMYTQFQTSDVRPHAGVAKRDADILHAVKEYLDKTFLEEHSVTGLARHFGTNTNKLMMLFKKLFGKSIFEHLQELKMDYARKLLEDGSYVAEVAREVGYKNPHHFSTAFKRRFGRCPSFVKA